MKKSSRNIQNRRSYTLISIALLSIVTAVVIPGWIWRPAPETFSIGPSSYSSETKKQPTIVPIPLEATSEPTTISIEFQYRVSQRPSDYSYLFATANVPDAGVRVSLDKWGNTFLSVESKKKEQSAFQLIQISPPHELNTWLKVNIFIDTNSGTLEIYRSDERIVIVEARNNYSVQMNDMLLTTSNVEIGGMNGHEFDGDIKDFEITFGMAGLRIHLINLKLFFALFAMVSLGLLIQSLKRDN